MRQIPYVTDAEAALARLMEQKVLSLAKEAGILFVGVSVAPSIEVPTYLVWVGCERDQSEEAVAQLVEMVLSKMITSGAHVRVEVRRGRVKEVDR